MHEIKLIINKRASLKIAFGHEQPLYDKGLRVTLEKITEYVETPKK